jgi:hypothetical protein
MFSRIGKAYSVFVIGQGLQLEDPLEDPKLTEAGWRW